MEVGVAVFGGDEELLEISVCVNRDEELFTRTWTSKQHHRLYNLIHAVNLNSSH